MTVTVDFDFERQIRKASSKRLIRTSDGDTPIIEQPIRMVSIDTPEKAQYAGGPPISQLKLDRCKTRLQNGFFNDLPQSLRDYLVNKITPDAAERHIAAAQDASLKFEEILETRLRIDEDSVRKLAIIPTGEIIDGYGRMLAYIAPWFSGPPSDPLPSQDDPARRTFNLEMVESGWAAFFPIYPSIPRNEDMNRAIAAAENAWNNRLGAWEEYGEDLLLAYEFRACIKLAEPVVRATHGNLVRRFYTDEDFEEDKSEVEGWEITKKTATDMIDKAFQRYCVDLRYLTVVGKYEFSTIPPSYRMWIWEDDLNEAIDLLELQF